MFSLRNTLILMLIVGSFSLVKGSAAQAVITQDGYVTPSAGTSVGVGQADTVSAEVFCNGSGNPTITVAVDGSDVGSYPLNGASGYVWTPETVGSHTISTYLSLNGGSCNLDFGGTATESSSPITITVFVAQ